MTDPKNAKFHELFNFRVHKVFQSMRVLEHLASVNYNYTQEDLDFHFGRMQERIDQLRARFDERLNRPVSGRGKRKPVPGQLQLPPPPASTAPAPTVEAAPAEPPAATPPAATPPAATPPVEATPAAEKPARKPRDRSKDKSRKKGKEAPQDASQAAPEASEGTAGPVVSEAAAEPALAQAELAGSPEAGPVDDGDNRPWPDEIRRENTQEDLDAMPDFLKRGKPSTQDEADAA